jgi:quinol monooxygenase YgiN
MKNRREFLETAAAGALAAALAGSAGGQTVNESQPNRKWVVVTAINTAAEGKAEELKKELSTTAPPTREEPGCIVFDLYQSSKDKNLFLRFEIWTNEESLNRHSEMPHVKASRVRRAEKKLTAAPVQGIIWTKVDG